MARTLQPILTGCQMAASDQRLAVEEAFGFQLPEFPAQSLAPVPQDRLLYSAYVWANAVVALYGQSAYAVVEAAVKDATERNDLANWLGWTNVKFALNDTWRCPLPGEAVH